MLIGTDGRCVTGRGLRGPSAVARKLHLPNGPTADEARHFVPGEDFAVLEVGALSVGCLICYDRRFPGMLAGDADPRRR